MAEPAQSVAGSKIQYWAFVQFVGTVLLVSVVIGLLVHEWGHALTGAAMGAEIKGVYVYPGVEIYPDFGDRYPYRWGTKLGAAIVDELGLGWADWQHGLVSVMGSGSTLMVSYLGIRLLYALRPRRRFWRYLLIALALYFFDILSYSLFPQLGLRHWIVFGGRFAEPVYGAERMGIPSWLFVTVVVVICMQLIWALARFVRGIPEPAPVPAEFSSPNWIAGAFVRLIWFCEWTFALVSVVLFVGSNDLRYRPCLFAVFQDQKSGHYDQP